MKRVLFNILVSFLIVTPLAAQDQTLKGKVVPADNTPPKLWGGIRIVVKNRANDQEISGEQRVTMDQDWFHGAPLGARVDVLFDKDCYVPDFRGDILVGQGTNSVETVKLQRAPECVIADRRQSQTHVLSIELGAMIQSQSMMIKGQAGVSVSTSVALPPAEARSTREARELLPSPDALRAQLGKEAALDRRGGFYDTFQYNFAVKTEVYREHPDLKQVLSDFRGNSQNQDLFNPIGDSQPEMFSDLIRSQFELPGAVDVKNISKLIHNNSLSPSVRGSATVALLNQKLDTGTRTEIAAYFKTQDQNSAIFTTALLARARLGDATLYEDFQTSKDPNQLTYLMEVIAAARIAESSNPMSDASQFLADVARKNENPTVRASALFSLRAFAYRSDKIAINALIEGLKEDRDPVVRFKAAVALGVGDLEKTAFVHKVLVNSARMDRSSDVRRAANFSLSGARWMGAR